jgi:hypothetical protein
MKYIQNIKQNTHINTEYWLLYFIYNLALLFPLQFSGIKTLGNGELLYYRSENNLDYDWNINIEVECYFVVLNFNCILK